MRKTPLPINEEHHWKFLVTNSTWNSLSINTKVNNLFIFYYYYYYIIIIIIIIIIILIISSHFIILPFLYFILLIYVFYMKWTHKM